MTTGLIWPLPSKRHHPTSFYPSCSLSIQTIMVHVGCENSNSALLQTRYMTPTGLWRPEAKAEFSTPVFHSSFESGPLYFPSPLQWRTWVVGFLESLQDTAKIVFVLPHTHSCSLRLGKQHHFSVLFFWAKVTEMYHSGWSSPHQGQSCLAYNHKWIMFPQE